MSEQKLSPRELAIKFLNGVLPSLKKYEEVLAKANTAHEIEDGGEPQSAAGSEIPQSLVSAAPKAGSSKSNSIAPKKKVEGEEDESEEDESEESGEAENKSEPAEMEDQPLSGESEESEESDIKKKKFEFAKAEKIKKLGQMTKAIACPPTKQNNKESQKDKMLAPQKVKHGEKELEKKESDKGIVKLKKFMGKIKEVPGTAK